MSPLLQVAAQQSPSQFRTAINFFERLGVYDVVLPFLLIFTLVFAILEKTKAFGTEEIEGKKVTRKNLNSMAAFVIAFIVVASSRLVSVINTAVANTMLLLILGVLFLMLVGAFHKETKEGFFLEGGWQKAFMWIMVIGIFLIFLNALGWLAFIYDYIFYNFGSATVGSILLIVIVIAFMAWIVKGEKAPEKKE